MKKDTMLFFVNILTTIEFSKFNCYALVQIFKAVLPNINTLGYKYRFQSSAPAGIILIVLILFLNLPPLLSAAARNTDNDIFIDNNASNLMQTGFRRYFFNMNQIISLYTGPDYKSKPVNLEFNDKITSAEPVISIVNNTVSITLDKNYKVLLSEQTRLGLINDLFLNRFDLEANSENIKNVTWITSVISEKLNQCEKLGYLPSVNTFPVLHKLLLSGKKIAIKKIIDNFPEKINQDDPVFKFYNETAEVLLAAILKLNGGYKIIDNYVIRSCSDKYADIPKGINISQSRFEGLNQSIAVEIRKLDRCQYKSEILYSGSNSFS